MAPRRALSIGVLLLAVVAPASALLHQGRDDGGNMSGNATASDAKGAPEMLKAAAKHGQTGGCACACDTNKSKSVRRSRRTRTVRSSSADFTYRVTAGECGDTCAVQIDIDESAPKSQSYVRCRNLCTADATCLAFEYEHRGLCMFHKSPLVAGGNGAKTARCYVKSTTVPIPNGECADECNCGPCS
mmetsp:Transcript_92975/g.263124  ORF Transcript_92975/g.263124 Transcript_92975/m.263124 type:complete len:187 (+) Transcript_92975:68-628(+)